MEKQEPKMSPFVKFVLVILTGVFVIAAVMAITLIVSPKRAHAEDLVLFQMEDGTLLVYSQTMKIPDVPEEIRKYPKLVFQLVTGQVKRVLINGKAITYQPQQRGVQYTDPPNPWLVISIGKIRVAQK